MPNPASFSVWLDKRASLCPVPKTKHLLQMCANNARKACWTTWIICHDPCNVVVPHFDHAHSQTGFLPSNSFDTGCQMDTSQNMRHPFMAFTYIPSECFDVLHQIIFDYTQITLVRMEKFREEKINHCRKNDYLYLICGIVDRGQCLHQVNSY